MDDLNDRGTGRTTRQMLDAPQHAVFVWCNDYLGYARDLVHHVGRPDLQVVSPSWLERDRGFGKCGIVIDHAARLSDRQAEGAELIRARYGENRRG
ncbi:hypothetical protein [Burkholderia ambifaria]|jgi:hypothetical protein|uniref:hypothetical protein n=1 Tax=Burkholderia ambifaria TaxID=152480 RepID=UPI00158B51E3|nr:hypothetical protein [Burkholderia ambifaria]